MFYIHLHSYLFIHFQGQLYIACAKAIKRQQYCWEVIHYGDV